MPRWSLPALLFAALLAWNCAEPPSKEMNQAQGAIAAAKAAGADRYATEEYNAAVAALQRSQDAVAQRDYRLALNHALDSRERAQDAARQAADTKAQIRGEVERTMAEIAALLAQSNVKLGVAQKVRVPRRVLREPIDDLAAVNADVQKAGEAMQGGDYSSLRPVLKDVKARIQKVDATLDAAIATQTRGRRR
jgi:hypothetical protein